MEAESGLDEAFVSFMLARLRDSACLHLWTETASRLQKLSFYITCLCGLSMSLHVLYFMHLMIVHMLLPADHNLQAKVSSYGIFLRSISRM